MLNFQIVIFAIIFETVNGHTHELFKSTLNDVHSIKIQFLE